jgi:hypothetical protein
MHDLVDSRDCSINCWSNLSRVIPLEQVGQQRPQVRCFLKIVRKAVQCIGECTNVGVTFRKLYLSNLKGRQNRLRLPCVDFARRHCATQPLHHSVAARWHARIQTTQVLDDLVNAQGKLADIMPNRHPLPLMVCLSVQVSEWILNLVPEQKILDNRVGGHILADNANFLTVSS